MKNLCLSAIVFLFWGLTLSMAQPSVNPEQTNYTAQSGFVANLGQSEMLQDHLFSWKHNNVFAYFMKDRIVFLTQEIRHEENPQSAEAKAKGDENRAKRLAAKTYVSRFDLVFENALSAVEIQGEDENSVQMDFYYAHCPEGLLKVPSFNNIRYKNIWQNIDLVFTFDGTSLKYFFEVAPGANIHDIVLRWDGVENLELNDKGELQFNLGAFTFYDKAPVSFCGKSSVETSFILDGNQTVFEIGSYDNTQTLVIDPGLYWASSTEYNGYGSWGEVVSASSGIFYIVDWEWNPGGADLVNYMASATTFSNFSSDASNEDIVISKFSKDGALMWVCKYGGTGDDDVNGGVEIDDNNNLYIAGTTSKEFSATSGNFPLQTLTGAFNQVWDGSLSTGRRGYLLKFSSSNTRLWATYLDRGANLEVFDIACGLNNNIYMTGMSGGSPTYIYSGTIPSGTGYSGALNGTSTAHNFILQFNNSGALYWSTWLPGATASTSMGRCSDIAVNKSNGYFYLAGDDMWSSSTRFNTAIISASYTNQGDNDMFYMAFNSSNQPIPSYGKYVGGAGFDKINVGAANGDIELDASGNLYLCGHTYSANFPAIVNPGNCAYFDGTINDGSGIVSNEASTQDGYLYKVNTSGTVTYGTFFGGAAYTAMKKLKKDSHGNLWICGQQNSTGLAQSSRTGYFNQAFTGTSTNVLFAQLGTNDNLEWLAYYGFVTGYAGYNGFDIYEPAADSVYINYAGNFNYTINTGGGYQYSATSTCSGAAQFRNYYTTYAPFTISGTTTFCVGGSATWTASSSGGSWSSANTTVATINASSGLLNALSSGTTTITYTLTVLGCPFTQSATVTVNAVPNVTASAASPTICNGNSTNISASGATTYSWSHSLGTNSTYSVSPTTTTTYTVTGTSNGCTDVATVTVTVNAVPNVTASAASPTICNGNSTNISASGATTYSWSHSLGTNSTYSVSPTTTTTYTVTGTSNGCTDVATVTVTVNAVPNVTASAASPTICNGNSTNISASGATTYSWSHSLGTNSTYSVSPTTTTTYTVTGTSNGCTDVATVTVTVNAVPNVTASAASPTICNGNSTNISASGATTYSWSHSLGTNSTYSVSPTSTTTYTVTGTSNGCTDVATVTVTVNAVPNVTASAASPTICNGSSTTVSASGATSYAWSPSGSGSSFSASPTTTTIYTVTGTSNGCTDVATVTVTVNAVPNVTASASSPTICNGSSTTVSASGATSYAWSPSGSGSSFSASPTTTTIYTVTGTSNGCTDVATVTVNVTPLPNVVASVSDGTICNGESSTISVTGASTYNWSGLGSNSSYTVNPTTTTVYSVTGTSIGCSNSATVTITVNPKPDILASATYPSLCEGENTDIIASGGISYTWDNSLGSGASHNVTPLSTTIYNVTGTDNMGCTNTASVTVTIALAPAVSVIAGTTSLCVGSSTTLNATGAVNYSWDQGLGTGGSFIISPTTTTTYHVTGSSATGCSATAEVTVTVNPVPNDPTASGLPSQICLGDSAVITASGSGSVDYEVYSAPTNGSYLGDASLVVHPTTTTVYYVQAVNSFGCANTGGRVPVTIIVNPLPAQPVVSASDTTICDGQSVALLADGSGSGVVYEVWTDLAGGTNLGYAPMMVSPSTTTTYYIQAVTAAGCSPATGRVGFTFTVVPITDAVMNPAGPFCASDAAVTLTAVNAGGIWAGTGITNTASGIFDPVVAGVGTHEITYTTTGACPDTDTMDVVVSAFLDATITPAGPFCATDAPVTLSAATSGGTWSGTGITNTTSGTFDPATAGVGAHEIIYTTSGSCGDADTIDVVVSAVTDAAMNPAGPFCASDAAVTLTAVNAGGIWAGTGITNTASGIFDPVVAGVGTHEITYTTTGACPDTDTMDVVVSAFLDATITPAGPFCATDAPVTLSAATSGGTWSGTGITNTTSGTFDPATAGVGAHEIIYTTSGSCGDTDTIQIQVVSQMDATIAAAGPFCDNEAAVVLSAANTGGVWSGPGITNTATGAFDPSVAGSGIHEIFYTISGSCGDADSIDIVVYESPEFTYVSIDESCTGAGDGSIVLTVTGGVNPITYTWSNGAATVSLDGIGEGSYSVTVSDAHGCSRNATITLGDPGVPCDDITPHAVVPNAFSPNGDGENDMLYVRGEGITQLSFIVYDRWGEKVFSTTSLSNGWDGTFRGKELDPAVFTYYLHAIFMDGTDKIEKGDVTLTR